MNRPKFILLILALGLMAGGAGVVFWFKLHQHLGEPGLNYKPIADSTMVDLSLPEKAAGFDSTNVPTAKVVLDYLPKDTSYAQRVYFAPDGLWVDANVILMGADRTSIHKPNYCIPGQGWEIEKQIVEKIPVAHGSIHYELPVSKWLLRKSFETPQGAQQISALYVFWFVAKNDQTPIHFNFMRSLAWHLVTTGELERWAYVSYFTECMPGQEDATFERVKKLIAASVPEFQLPPQSAGSNAIAKQ
jgi:hypothetical protein